MFNPANALSFLRGPLALLFLFDSVLLRTIAIMVAIISDCFDGFLARRCGFFSKFGAFLDPLMDKFFVYFAMFILLSENALLPWQASFMISRDIVLCLFGIYISLTGGWKSCQFRSMITGKISTAMQFTTLLMIVQGFHVSDYFYLSFAVVGTFVFLELMRMAKEPQNL